MNAPKFTPGPWVQGHAPGAHWVNLPGLARGINAGSAANAALIAAAPELYAQLEFAVKLLGGLPGFAGTAQIESMRAALTKVVQP